MPQFFLYSKSALRAWRYSRFLWYLLSIGRSVVPGLSLSSVRSDQSARVRGNHKLDASTKAPAGCPSFPELHHDLHGPTTPSRSKTKGRLLRFRLAITVWRHKPGETGSTGS